VQPQAATSAACCLLADEVEVAVPPHETDRKILKSAQQGYQNPTHRDFFLPAAAV
jgi:hypothetical protein